MSIEEQQFDDLIRSKYLGEEEELTWDKAKVWESIRPTKHYRFAYFKYAASLAILIGILYYVLLGGEKTKNVLVQLPVKHTKIIIQPVYEQSISGNQKTITHLKMNKKLTKIVPFSGKNIENSTKTIQEVDVSIISERNSEVILQKEQPDRNTRLNSSHVD